MQWFNDFKAAASKKLAQFKNENFKNAAMATCALISAADGAVSKEERSKTAKLIGSSEMLQSFDAAELKLTFDMCCDMADDEFKRIDLLRTVGKLKSSPDQADAVVRAAIVLANADGDFDESEKGVVREICGVLGLKADEYLVA